MKQPFQYWGLSRKFSLNWGGQRGVKLTIHSNPNSLLNLPILGNFEAFIKNSPQSWGDKGGLSQSWGTRGAKKSILWITIVTLFTILFPTTVQAQTTRIIEINGEATLQKKDESQERLATVGTELELGDLLITQTGTVVWVRCANGRLNKADSGVQSGLKAICPNTTPSTRARAEDIFLDLLFGRFVFTTQFLDAQPLLRWDAIPGVTNYQVQILQDDNIIWQTSINATEIRYQGIALEPGIDYQLRVKPTNSQENESIYELWFMQLDAATTATIQAEVAEIEAEAVGEEAKILMLVDFYREVGQSDEAEDKPGLLLAAAASLETLVQQGNSTPTIHRLLGELYLLTGQLQQAEIRYQEAIKLAEQSDNLVEQAEAEIGLAHVYVAMGKLTESRQILEIAQKKYIKFNKTNRMERLEQWIERIRRKENQSESLLP
ncbi:MAG: tetratricopeptide repeat protein [Microcoleaceae cyanobacterium]